MRSEAEFKAYEQDYLKQKSKAKRIHENLKNHCDIDVQEKFDYVMKVKTEEVGKFLATQTTTRLDTDIE